MGVCNSKSLTKKKTEIKATTRYTKKSKGTMTDLNQEEARPRIKVKKISEKSTPISRNPIENPKLIKHYQTEMGYYQVEEDPKTPFSKNVTIVRKPRNSDENFDLKNSSKGKEDKIQRSVTKFFKGRKITLESISNLEGLL